MTLLKDLLADEPRIVSVPLTATVLDAVKVMVEANCGSTMVMDGERPAGIFTERDLMRWVVQQEREAGQTQVADMMTADLVYAQLTDSVSAAILLMQKHHIRHLPIRNEDGTFCGVLSIRDLIHEKVREMRDYIACSEG